MFLQHDVNFTPEEKQRIRPHVRFYVKSGSAAIKDRIWQTM